MSNQKQNNRPRGPMGHGMRGGEKAKDFKGTMKKLLNYIKPFKFSFLVGLLCAIVSVCIMVIGPKIQGNIITEIAQGFMNKVQGKGGIDFDAIQKTCALLLAIYALSTAFSYLQGWLMSGVSNKMGYKLRKEMNQKIDKLPLSYFDKNSHGDILSRFTNDVDTLVQSLNQSLSTMVSSFVQIIGFLVMMLSISWKMTLMALIVIPLSLVLVMVVVKKSQRYFKAQQKSLGLVNGHIEEMYSELKGIIATIKEPHLRQLTEECFINDREFVKEFKVHSAAKSVHHGFIGGLLQHTLAVTKMCVFLADNYPILDRDLLVTAAIFHDIGKVTELSDFPMNDYTDDGQLLGHIFIGAELIGNKIRQISGFPPVLATELRHCILAHHGELEYGSPKKPAIAEAMALNFADNTDAKLETMTEIYDKANPTTEWLGFNRFVDSNIRQSTGSVAKRK